MSEWISVEDELPSENYSHVLVYCKGGNIEKTYCIRNRDDAKSYFEGSYTRSNQGKWSACFKICWEYGYTVTHWMPLPKPPES